MSNTYTPGPWNAKITESGTKAIFNTDGIWIAQTLRRQWKTEDAANANLIAAAPENYPLQLFQHEGYDHSYFFIASFIEAHIRFHAGYLK